MPSIQDAFLEELRKKNLVSNLYLTNGFHVSGLIKGFDNFTVLVETSKEKKAMIIFKHAITTVSPEGEMNLKEVLSNLSPAKQVQHAQGNKGNKEQSKDNVNQAQKGNTSPPAPAATSTTKQPALQHKQKSTEANPLVIKNAFMS